MNSYFICATQPKNLGDLIINKVLIDEMCLYGKVFLDAYNLPGNFIEPLMENPNVVNTSELGFSVKRPTPIRLLKFMRFLKKEGVKLLTKSPGPMSSYPFYLRCAFSLINFLARLSGAKVVYIGNCCSANYTSNVPVDNLHMDAVYLRSKETINYAKQYLPCEVNYIPDLAYLLKPKTNNVVKKKKVALDFRLPDSNADKVLNDIKDIASQFIKHGYEVEVYYQVSNDKRFAERLYEQFKEDGVKFHDEIVWYKQLDYYADKAFVVSNRLHSLIFGAIYSAIPVARITNSPKLSKIQHVFQSSLPFPIWNSIHVEDPLDVNSLLTNEFMLRSQVDECIERNRQLCRSTILGIYSTK